MLQKSFVNYKLESGLNSGIKICCLADCHNKIKTMRYVDYIKDADLYIFPGDMTVYGTQPEFETFLNDIKILNNNAPKIIVGGNHDHFLTHVDKKDIETWKLNNCFYLQDQKIDLEIKGKMFKIYGFPWLKKTDKLSPHDAFCIDDKTYSQKLNQIPSDIDILISHEPPYSIGDLCSDYNHVGSSELLDKVLSIRPQYHIFGHIHENNGWWKCQGINFINASICNVNYEPNNKPISMSIPLSPLASLPLGSLRSLH